MGVGRSHDPLATWVILEAPNLTGPDSVRNERPVCGDKGGDRWHLRDRKVFSCKSQGGAIHYRQLRSALLDLRANNRQE